MTVVHFQSAKLVLVFWLSRPFDVSLHRHVPAAAHVLSSCRWKHPSSPRKGPKCWRCCDYMSSSSSSSWEELVCWAGLADDAAICACCAACCICSHSCWAISACCCRACRIKKHRSNQHMDVYVWVHLNAEIYCDRIVTILPANSKTTMAAPTLKKQRMYHLFNLKSKCQTRYNAKKQVMFWCFPSIIPTLANNSCCCLRSSSSGIPRFSSRELAFLLFRATVLHSWSTSFTSVMYEPKPRLSRAACGSICREICSLPTTHKAATQ